MTFTNKFIILSFTILLINCDGTNDCISNLNQLPEYGRQRKCQEEIEIDNEFLFSCDSSFKDRKEAAKYYVRRAWDYYGESKLDTAMFRFNQAWMLDSTNADVYWGFGTLLGMKKQFKESIPFFEKSIKLNPSNPIVFESISKSYGQMFVQDTNIVHLDKAIDYLKISISMAPNVARTYGHLTGLYIYFLQKDSALKYLAITDKLDSSAVNPEVRQILTQN
jgi:tetratricopeptide (TPR) repeat protein